MENELEGHGGWITAWSCFANMKYCLWNVFVLHSYKGGTYLTLILGCPMTSVILDVYNLKCGCL